MNTAHVLCVLASVISTLICSATTISLPPSYKMCSRNDPEFRECMIQNVQNIISKSIHGNPEWNIPNLDPIEIAEEIPIEGPFGLKFSDVKIYGLEEATLYDVNVDFEKQNLSYSFLMPKCVLLGNYTATGGFSGLDVNGTGNFNLTMDNLDLTISLPYDLITKDDGKRYIQLNDQTEMRLKAAVTYINLENISDGDEDLGKLVNEFLNEHWQEWMDDFTPMLGKVTGEAVRKGIVSIKKIPFDDFFLEK